MRQTDKAARMLGSIHICIYIYIFFIYIIYIREKHAHSNESVFVGTLYTVCMLLLSHNYRFLYLHVQTFAKPRRWPRHNEAWNQIAVDLELRLSFRAGAVCEVCHLGSYSYSSLLQNMEMYWRFLTCFVVGLGWYLFTWCILWLRYGPVWVTLNVSDPILVGLVNSDEFFGWT